MKNDICSQSICELAKATGLKAETLEKAQADPASYADLQIRVCGWNEYFVNMSRAAQNDFIARAKENE